MLAKTIAACLLLASHTSTRSSVFVSATENHAAQGGNHPVVSPDLPPEHAYTGDEIGEGESVGYVPDFAYFGRSLLGRQNEEVKKLKTEGVMSDTVSPKNTLFFVLETGKLPTKREDSLRALDVPGEDTADTDVETRHPESKEASAHVTSRQSRRRIWISVNTCKQPTPKEGKKPEGGPPQLVLYASDSPDNQKPGPDSTNNLVTNSTGIQFDGGFVSLEVNATSNLYVGIHAPELNGDWNGNWGFDIAASTEGAYHSHNREDPLLFMVDTDSESTLFITYDLTEDNSTEAVERWEKANPFTMYAFPADVSPVTGMENSVCALEQQFEKTNNFTVQRSITTQFGVLNRPRSQFDVHGLDNGKSYKGYLVAKGNQETVDTPLVGRVRGGGRVFKQFTWTTKVEDSCQVLTGLEFCNKVAYAVPSSFKFKFDDDALRKLYDDQAKEYYEGFNNSLAQVACEADPTSRYSLAITCDDCRETYKDWLCSVLIPRCEDWTANDIWLQPRNVNAQFADNSTIDFGRRKSWAGYNNSRNPMIDEEIKPGPYREVLPCDDLCFDMVRTCPAQLGFACPEKPLSEQSYGERDPEGNALTCNFPGAVVKLVTPSAASLAGVGVQGMFMPLVVVALFFFM